MTGAHIQAVNNKYLISYPDHEPRESDPHYLDFHHWKESQRGTPAWRCAWAARIDDDSECDLTKPLEAHHTHIEFALLNAVDLRHLEKLYPGVSDPSQVGAWVESAANLELLCAKHHRAASAGVHHLAYADWEASAFLVADVFRAAG